VVAGQPWRPGQHSQHEPRHCSLGLDTKKKTLGATERNEVARAAWHDLAEYLPAERLIFVDECGTHIALTPLYARAPRGQRAYGSVPCNRGTNTTLIAGLSLVGMQAPFILEGAVNTLAFEAYVEQVLAPSLSPGQIVVLDNLSAHTGERVRQAITAKGCQVLWLPTYSPDLTPIEEAFSKLKAFLRRVGARTHELLQEAIGWGLETITSQDATGWFTHCGYPPAEHTKEASGEEAVS
jgi:transposase